MRVVGGQRVVRPVRAADAWRAGEQVDERRLCLHQHPRARRRQIARESDELQRVPQPLFGGENDASCRPGSRRPSAARRARADSCRAPQSRAANRIRASLRANSPMREQRQSEVPVRLRKVGSQRRARGETHRSRRADRSSPAARDRDCSTPPRDRASTPARAGTRRSRRLFDPRRRAQVPGCCGTPALAESSATARSSSGNASASRSR